MQLKSKSLTGVVQPLSYVDKMLRQQGFYRAGGENTPTYDVVIYDSATSTSYFLRIPTSYTQSPSGKGEISVRLGQPYLEAKFYMHLADEEILYIPQAIREAALHKLAEIADYLSSPPPAE
ncbi:hypothetical protein G3578_09690 [Brevibacillus sp. SYP-B805]|uniref:hypothetical protein n=1 Tax=Brevibacillus sp. SYP-B805 TaxID=1578199 RepID=UPI0013EDD0B9|nr:hypothetical protein [Brevibacillus sp. SYP-B805]NGQ95426.1 hypothetical protein [Brevibacillus sp. SYP-B805]